MDTIKLVWAGESMGPVRVDNWPNAMRTFKTIGIYADNFSGNLLIEASLATNPGENDWFPYYNADYIRPVPTVPTPGEPWTRFKPFQNTLISNRDRVIWMRVTVTRDHWGGRLDRVIVL